VKPIADCHTEVISKPDAFHSNRAFAHLIGGSNGKTGRDDAYNGT
jgi:hypothetical protein